MRFRSVGWATQQMTSSTGGGEVELSNWPANNVPAITRRPPEENECDGSVVSKVYNKLAREEGLSVVKIFIQTDIDPQRGDGELCTV